MVSSPKIYLSDIDHNVYPCKETIAVMHFSYAHGQLENIVGYDIILGNIKAMFLLSTIGEHPCVAIDLEGNQYDCLFFVAYDKITKCNRGLVCLDVEEETSRTRQTMEIFAETGIL